MFLFRKKSRRTQDDPKPETRSVAPAPLPPMPEPAPSNVTSAEAELRKRRRPAAANKTRLMGFDTSDGRVAGLFGEDKATTETGRSQFPVGLVMVVKGPGYGESFAIKSGMSQIGRGEGQAIRLDFGDMAISRENHAAIVYDPKDQGFLLGHGGKANLVRLNGKPVVTTTDLAHGDEIEIGETRLRFVAICSPEFTWNTGATEEGSDDDDVEIA